MTVLKFLTALLVSSNFSLYSPILDKNDNYLYCLEKYGGGIAAISPTPDLRVVCIDIIDYSLGNPTYLEELTDSQINQLRIVSGQ